MSAHREAGWVELLARMLRDSPRLTGALCPGRHHIFDAEQGDQADREYAQRRAVALCQQCPALTACREWASTQRDLCGVVGGEVRHPRPADDAKRKKPKRPKPKPRPRPQAVPA
jgi:WhiB family transcriptional regulator, redox-sensing transcriptional regulator